MKDKKRLVILDTHAILHRAYHALPDFASSRGEPTGALYGLISMLVKIIADLKPDYIVAAFDLPEPTHRHIAFAEYKSQRMKTDDALVAQIILSRGVLDALGVALYECPQFEADDVIGTIVEEMSAHGRSAVGGMYEDVDIIIASGDMDTLQLVEGTRVRAYTLRQGLTDTIIYDEEKVRTRYGFGPEHIVDFKGLRGDPSDNIPGVKGVGEKTATTLIMEFGSLEHIYETLKKHPEKLTAAGIKPGMIQKLTDQEEQAEFSKQLAIIRRDAPINFVLPPAWKENVSMKKILDMLQKFEFRSLIPRIKTVVGVAVEDQQQSGEGGVVEESDGSLFAAIEQVDHTDFCNIALAAWVIDSNITQPTLEDIYRIGKADTFVKAKASILQEIKDKGLTFVYEKIELPLTPVLRGMEEAGVAVDLLFLQKLSQTYKKELAAISVRIFEAAGQEFNINSPKQLGDILFDTLGLGAKNQKNGKTEQSEANKT